MQSTETNAAKGSNTTWDMGTDTTLIHILARNAELLGNRVAMREKHLGIWQETTWSQMLDTTLACAAGMESLGFGAEDALLVMGDNRPRLYMGMLAAGVLGGYAMPVYSTARLCKNKTFCRHPSRSRAVKALFPIFGSLTACGTSEGL